MGEKWGKLADGQYPNYPNTNTCHVNKVAKAEAISLLKPRSQRGVPAP